MDAIRYQQVNKLSFTLSIRNILTNDIYSIFSVRSFVSVYSCTIRILPNMDVFPVFLRNDAFLLRSLADLCFRYIEFHMKIN